MNIPNHQGRNFKPAKGRSQRMHSYPSKHRGWAGHGAQRDKQVPKAGKPDCGREGCCVKHSDVGECSAKNPGARLCWKLGDSSGKSHSWASHRQWGGWISLRGSLLPPLSHPDESLVSAPVQGFSAGCFTGAPIAIVDTAGLGVLTAKGKADLYSVQRTKNMINLLKNWDTYLSTIFQN